MALAEHIVVSCLGVLVGVAAIGKNGTQICLHKKDDVLFRVPF